MVFKWFLKSCAYVVLVYVFFVFLPTTLSVFGAITPTPTLPPIPNAPLSCSVAENLGTCPKDLRQAGVYVLEPCVDTYEQFIQNPLKNHFWALDQEVTDQGKADERARQFVYWVVSKNSIDDHPGIKTVWNMTRNVTLFLFVLVVSLFGLGYIIGQQSNFQIKIELWPNIMKIVLGLLYISFSFAITIFIIQISEILMKFFIENLGGKDLFNVYFGASSSEVNYTNFIGCKDLNFKVQEAIKTELFILKLRNVTYYVMGVMLLLRKILLWFLIFVSPFLVLLMPFVFIRNIGWIWIGVFFQWVFYGPLFALFLGALSTIWKRGIPYPFEFSRAGNLLGYIYPTGINIVYGGPGQIGTHKIGAINNGNYVDTYTEYIISLIMLWAVTFFPWWLLRIFRDYCCDGIYAMKNILMGMFDKMAAGPGPKPPSSGPMPTPSTTGTSLKLPHEVETKTTVKTHIETIEQVKKSTTEEIHKSLDLSMTKLTDVARFETNKQTHEAVQKNLTFLSQPTKAETPAERQKFMNIRTELFNRSIKEDKIAQQMLSSISSSTVERNIQKERIIKTVPQSNSVFQSVATKTNIAQDKVSSVSSSFITSVLNNNSVVNHLSQTTNAPVSQVKTILTSYQQNLSQPTYQSKFTPKTSTQTITQSPQQIITNISKQTGIQKEQVSSVIQNVASVAKSTAVTNSFINTVASNEKIVSNIAQQTMTTAPQIRTVLTSYRQHTHKPTVEAVKQIAQQTGVAEEKITTIIKSVSDIAKNNSEVVKAVALKENIKVEDVEKVVSAQVPLVTEPEKHIEETVAIPPSVSIEDYEEVKKMWTSQYEKGEVPVTENITTRDEWVENDIVFITNTLNKLMSSDDKLKQEGVDDLSYILPIFLINNLKGEELVVYLKAKIEAAKHVKEMRDMEKQITEKLKSQSQQDEELVEIEKPKQKEEAKHMEMQMEIDESQDKPKEEPAPESSPPEESKQEKKTPENLN